MSEHTKEPWTYEQDRTIYGPDGQTIADMLDVEEGLEGDCPWTDANARRIVACVNACAGLTTEFLEQVPIKLDGRKKGYEGEHA